MLTHLRRTATLAVVVLAACDDGTGPQPADGAAGIRFSRVGASYSAAGMPAAESGSVLRSEFALAIADSLGGFSVIGYAPTGETAGDLFVLQAPRRTGTHACTTWGAACHGRLITGIRDGSTAEFEAYYQVTEGTLNVTQIGPERLTATFQLTMRALDGDEVITIDDGVIDVPYIDDQLTDGALACLLSLVGIGDGTCRH